jgi:uncharacterized protein
MMSESVFKCFEKQSYLNLETYRKTGKAMRTPVWFSQDGEKIFVRTTKNAGKVKRVRNNSQVRIVPCAVNGDVQGEWIPARGRLATQQEAEQANQLLNKKYGFQKHMFEMMSKLRGGKWDVITIEPVTETVAAGQ